MEIDLRFNIIFLILIFFISCDDHEEKHLSLSSLFSNGMVLQKDSSVSIWGMGSPAQVVKVTSSWGTQNTVKPNMNGKWIVDIPTVSEPGPHTITVESGKEFIKVQDILLGEVWLAAGQSNMEMNFDYCCNTTDHSGRELSSANYPNLRMFNVKKNLSYEPVNFINGSWDKAIGSEISSFSAVGYFFAKKLNQELQTPIGIIHASWGGSILESWTSHDVLRELSVYDDEIKGIKEHQRKNVKARDWFSQYSTTKLPSGDFDLFLGEYLRDKDPKVDYLSYFLKDWKMLDVLGIDEINGIEKGTVWTKLSDNNSVDDRSDLNNFKGAVLFRNHFQLDDLDDDVTIRLESGEGMPWGLWEYDIYVNTKKVGSSLMTVEKEDYRFLKSPKYFTLDKKILKVGKNQLNLRIIGHARLGEISLVSSNRGELSLDDKWEYNLLGEEFFQIDDYEYPYMSLYSYQGQDVNLSKIPEKAIMNHHTIGTLFNGMLNPIIPYGIKGIIWYQGETNIERGGPEFHEYSALMPLMIEDLRKRWGHDLPFYYAQIAPYFNYNGMSPYFRDVQRNFLKIPGTGMVVTLDIGENYDIHPSNKHDVGDRFARLALSEQYGKEIISSGPLVKSAKLHNGKVRVVFDHIGSGLTLRNGNESEFELVTENKKFVSVLISNNRTYLDLSFDIQEIPKYLRYAFSDTSKAILFNLEGLPASSFEISID